MQEEEEEPLEDDESNAETAARVGLNPEGLSPEEEGLLPSGSQENLYVQVPLSGIPPAFPARHAAARFSEDAAQD